MTERVSVAMATYNGEKYIWDQLISLAQQERLPDEIIISDDSSTDKTVKIINEFSVDSPFPIMVMSNSEKLGVNRNFEKAIACCTGDIIFISDQDDVWFKEKISTMTDLLERDGDIELAINDAVIVQNDLTQEIGSLMANTIITAGRVSEYIPGCCTVITKKFRDRSLPFPHRISSEKVIGYDGWLHFLAENLNVKRVVDRPLQYYRRHENNVSQSSAYKRRVGIFQRFAYYKRKILRSVSHGAQREAELSYRISLFNTLIERISGELVVTGNEALRSKLTNINRTRELIETRIGILEMPRFKRSIHAIYFYFLGGYREFRGLKSLILDLVT